MRRRTFIPYSFEQFQKKLKRFATKNEKPSETDKREREKGRGGEPLLKLSPRRRIEFSKGRRRIRSVFVRQTTAYYLASPMKRFSRGVTLFLSLSPIPHSEGHVSSTAAEWSIRGTPFSPPHRSRSSLDRKVQTNEGRRSIEGAFAFWHARLP